MICSARDVLLPNLGRQALIVQRNELSARALARYLGLFYSAVVTVRSPGMVAEWFRRTAQRDVDLICGQRFDDADGVGSDWVQRWRQELPLRRVVMVSAEPLAEPPLGVDAIFSKPFDPAQLAEFLSLP